MNPVALLALCVAAAHGLPQASVDDAKYTLPKDFLLGGGTSSYQTEGGWQDDGKGPNVFDYGYHSKNATPNGDVAADFYHRYKEDIAIAAEIGFNVFRFSISWSRIFPNGRNTSVNELGVKHYSDLVDTLIENKIEPMVTLFHFDYPQALEEEFGGWLGDEMPDVFAAYADHVFDALGSKVKYWLTVNEASFYCLNLGGGMLEPKTFTTTEKQNTCLKNVLLGHAKAHEIYEKKYKQKYNGKVGFGSGPLFANPANITSAEDVAAAKKSNEVGGIALTMDVFIFGDFPEAAKVSRNISLTDAEKQQIKGRIDFVGINMYGGRNVSASDSDGGGGGPPGPPSGGGGGGDGGGPPDGGDGGSGGGPPDGGDGGSGGGPPDGGDGGSGGGPDGGNHPDGFGDDGSAWVLRVMPKWVKDRYDTVKELPIFITENGVQAQGNSSALDDWDSRAVYCSAFLRQLAVGINEDKTRVFGYTLWSFVDTFEFHSFSNWGLVHVDFAGGSLNRTKKASWTFFKRVMKTRVVPLVEKGSTPFPSGSAAFQSSIVLATAAVLLTRLFQ